MTRARSNRSGFEQRLVRTLRALELSPGERLVVAFSGGSDSLALAAAMARTAPVLRSELLLVHVNHRLRPHSARDAESCRQMAAVLGLPIEIIALETGLRDRTSGLGLEEAARRERYMALAEAATKFESETVMLAHQANDQAETVLMHLFRGAGIDGLAGMRQKEMRRIPWWGSPDRQAKDLTLLRPLLTETRAEIEAYIEQLGLQPVEDESNLETNFDRNWIRLEILPLIQGRWPAAVESIVRSSAVVDQDSRYLDELASSAFDSIADTDRTLCTDDLRTMHPSLRFRVLRRWLVSLGAEDVGFVSVDRLSELVLSQDESRRVELGGGIDAVLDGDRLTTYSALFQTVAAAFPIEEENGEREWDVSITADPLPEDVVLTIPAGAEATVQTVRNADRWLGTRRSVMEDLRQSGVHPLVRTRLLAVVADGGVLLIPAIYPTIHRGEFDSSGKKVGVRWSRRS